MDRVQRGIDYIFSSYKHTATALLIFGMILAIPFTISLVSQQQDTRSRAAPVSRLYFAPEDVSTSTLCQDFSIDLMVDPGEAPNNNIISIVDFQLNYDPEKIAFMNFQAGESFPTVIEAGGLDGQVNVSVSIGDDVTKAVETTTKVVTIKFRPLNAGLSQIQIDTANTRIFSLAPSDEPTENVLFSATPGQINIDSNACPDTITPTAILSPTPTPDIMCAQVITYARNDTTQVCQEFSNSCIPTGWTVDSSCNASLTPTPIIVGDPCEAFDSCPTSTPIPLATNTPVPTSVSSLSTLIGVSLSLDGLGIGSASSGLNNQPKTPQRTVQIEVYNALNQKVASQGAQVIYNPLTGLYTGATPLGNMITSNPALETGVYRIKIKSNNSLWKNYGGIYSLAPGNTTQLPLIIPVSGDINQDNQISLFDYMAVLNCYGGNVCSQKSLADLNDDGIVDELDINILYSGFAKRVGD